MPQNLKELVAPISDDLTSGAAEIALRAITVFQTVLSHPEDKTAEAIKKSLNQTAVCLVEAQPAMAPVFHLSNQVLTAVEKLDDPDKIKDSTNKVLADFERRLCESAAQIADNVFELIPAGELVFAYSFSSTVVSALLHARQKGRFFRAVCTESRPAMEGRKLANMLADGGLEVIHTFDSAAGLVLSECRACFMGADGISRPGVVNKVGSWMLAVACRELNIPIYAIAGTEKIVPEDRLFEFEKHERPGAEVWDSPSKGVAVLNRQFELVPFSLLSGVVTEEGILQEADIERHLGQLRVHESLSVQSESSSFAPR